jgi:hypothetical protein
LKNIIKWKIKREECKNRKQGGAISLGKKKRGKYGL